MDIELTHQNIFSAHVFKPIQQFSTIALYHQKIQLENSFFLSANNPHPQFLLTLAGSTLLISDSTAQRVQPFGAVDFSFDLKFELIYQSQKDVRSNKIGIRLLYDENRSLEVYSNSSAVVEAWTICLSQQLNQLGFHEMYKPLKKLGKGNFATVYQVERLTDRKRFAVKAFSKQTCFSAKNGKQSLLNELTIMRNLNTDSHSNVLRLECVFESDNSIYVILEILTGGQLFHKIQERSGYFTKEEIKEFMVGLLRGLKRLHSDRIMHRDLKPENIMLRKDSMSPVIVDFGLATHADVDKYLFYRCGTPGYVAPEIIGPQGSGHIEPQCDLFSAGVIFHILLTRRPVFEGSKYDEVYRKNKEMNFNLDGQIYKDIDGEAMSLLKIMLLADPKQRVTAEEALNHAYLTDITGFDDEKVSSPVTTIASPRRKGLLIMFGNQK